MRLRDLLPVTRGALEAAAAAAAKATRDELEPEIARLEGLLDTRDDIDQVDYRNFREIFRGIRGMRETSRRDFSATERRKILGLAHTAYALRGLGETVIETEVDFILGDALVPKAKTEDQAQAERHQKLLDEVWGDPRNALDHHHESHTLTWILEGELFLSADLAETDGHLELGNIDPLAVKDIDQDALGRDAFVRVERDSKSDDLYFVLNSLTPDIEIERGGERSYRIVERTADGDKEKTVAGLAFAGFWNRPRLARRGRSELTQIIDQIDARDELLWSSVEVQNLKKWFLMVVKDPSIRTAAQARKKLEELGLKSPPRNPKVLAVNDKVTVDVLNQQGSATLEDWIALELATDIMGSKGMPEHWRGSTSKRGLAGARAGDFVPLRRLRRKQRRVIRFWKKVLEVQLELRRRAGSARVPKDIDFEMVALEVGGKDRQRGAEILKAIATAITQAEGAGVIKPELGNMLFVAVAQELGITVPRDLEGVPRERPSDQVDAALQRALQSQRGRQDEGNQDEGDRDRDEERVAAGGRG